MYKQQVLVNDTLNLLRGKLVRFILEDGDLRMIANLVAVIDELGLEYDQEGMVYRDPKETQIRAKIKEERDQAVRQMFGDGLPEPEDDFFRDDEDAKSSHTNISRAQLAKELEPGLNALFGAEYALHDPDLSPEEREALKKKSAKDRKRREAARLERNRKAREKYHAKKAKPKRGRPRKEK